MCDLAGQVILQAGADEGAKFKNHGISYRVENMHALFAPTENTSVAKKPKMF